MATVTARLRLAAILAVVAFLAFGIYRAGLNEMPPPPSTPEVLFHRGVANGQRVESKSWSADYDKIVANQDQTMLEVDGIHHGLIYRKGKPYLRVRATHMSINTVSHDFTATGPVHVETVDHKPERAFDMSSAVWNDATQELTLSGNIRVSTGAARPLRVDQLNFNIRTGDLELVHVSGPVRFK
ncbi:MAG: hypothetical protein ACLPYS_13185 [Vulcanimicrobiaceae bacterium]